MSEKADRLGRVINSTLAGDKNACVDVEIKAIESAGLPLRSLAYADWLGAHNLRMRRLGHGWMRFCIAPELPSDLKAAADRWEAEQAAKRASISA